MINVYINKIFWAIFISVGSNIISYQRVIWRNWFVIRKQNVIEKDNLIKSCITTTLRWKCLNVWKRGKNYSCWGMRLNYCHPIVSWCKRRLSFGGKYLIFNICQNSLLFMCSTWTCKTFVATIFQSYHLLFIDYLLSIDMLFTSLVEKWKNFVYIQCLVKLKLRIILINFYNNLMFILYS